MKTVIAVPDFTREAHLKKILPELTSRLNKKGLQDKDIEILIATGLHRPPAKKEIKNMFGDISDKLKISVHNYKNVFYLGKSKNKIPIYMDKKLKGADSIITVGVVEPHLYAGYSGGIKVVSIGLAGEKTINATHHPRFLDHPGTRICSIKDNPFQDFVQEAGSMLPITYSINIINDENGNILKIFKGRPGPCFTKAVSYSEKIFEKRLNSYFDAVICDIPASKAVNMYQASRIFNYVSDVKNPVIHKNSLILVKADLEEGFGRGIGEKRFKKKMLLLKDPLRVISDIKKTGCLGGEHRAYMVAKALMKAGLGFISRRAYLYKDKRLPFLFFKDIEEAQDFIKKRFKKPKAYYLKNAFTSILTKNPC